MSDDLIARLRQRQEAENRKAVYFRRPRIELMESAAADEIERLQKELHEATALVVDLVDQSCAGRDGTIDSMALSTYANAMRWLAERQVIVIVGDFGRRVIGRWAGPT